MRKISQILLVLLFLSPIRLLAQTSNTVYVKNFTGTTVAQMVTAAQATCSPTLTCIVVFDPSLATITRGTLPAPCATCVWEDYSIPGALNITGNFYLNGTLVSGTSGPGGSGGTGSNGTLVAPAFSPGGGTYSGAQGVTISLPSGATGCYTVDGSTPAAVAGTCTNGATYLSPITVAASEALSALSTESGWTNSSVTTAVYTINQSSPGSNYSDNFTSANGAVSSNWTKPTATETDAGLQIINNEVYASKTPAMHALEIYTGGTFGNNQWSSFVVENMPTGSIGSSQAALVRGTVSTNYYNDAIPNSTVGGIYRIGNAAGNDFCAVLPSNNYSAGDTHELDVAGSGPVFFWSKRNGVVDATCLDKTYNITSGNPGVGFAADYNSTPTAALTSWQGGTLSNYSTTPTDNFQRANAGWLGVNWWFPEEGAGSLFTSYFVLNNNAATPTRSGGLGAAFWTTPFNVNQSSVINIGNIATNDWLAAAVRYTPSTLGNDQFYLVIVDNKDVEIFAYNKGTWGLLSNLGTYSGAISTLELDASGASPVTLTVKVNGTQFGNAYSDSTYLFTGTYAGFANYGSTSSVITGWQGGNL